jgi:uroporphyrinogen-III synthase
MPAGPFDAALALSPAGAATALESLPPGLRVLATGEGTLDALRARPDLSVSAAAIPKAEGLWSSLQALLPAGGRVLLIRAERSRGFLERAAEGTPWLLAPWTTHRELPSGDLRPVNLSAVLALGPAQAEALVPQARDLLRYAWGEATARAFQTAGSPAHAWCEPRAEALVRMLAEARRSL